MPNNDEAMTRIKRAEAELKAAKTALGDSETKAQPKPTKKCPYCGTDDHGATP